MRIMLGSQSANSFFQGFPAASDWSEAALLCTCEAALKFKQSSTRCDVFSEAIKNGFGLSIVIVRHWGSDCESSLILMPRIQLTILLIGAQSWYSSLYTFWMSVKSVDNSCPTWRPQNFNGYVGRIIIKKYWNVRIRLDLRCMSISLWRLLLSYVKKLEIKANVF